MELKCLTQYCRALCKYWVTTVSCQFSYKNYWKPLLWFISLAVYLKIKTGPRFPQSLQFSAVSKLKVNSESCCLTVLKLFSCVSQGNAAFTVPGVCSSELWVWPLAWAVLSQHSCTAVFPHTVNLRKALQNCRWGIFLSCKSLLLGFGVTASFIRRAGYQERLGKGLLLLDVLLCTAVR